MYFNFYKVSRILNEKKWLLKVSKIKVFEEECWKKALSSLKIQKKKSNIRSHKYFNNLVMGFFAKFKVEISKTVGGGSFSVNLKIINKNDKLQTGNCMNFQNIMNRHTSRCLLRGYNCFWDSFHIKDPSESGVLLPICMSL